jgi:hypothetical protein
MMICNVAVLVAALVPGWSIATAASLPSASAPTAATVGLSPADRALLADYARDTWLSIAALGDRGVLPPDSLQQTKGGWVADGLTSPTNIAAYLWSIIAAEDLRLISAEESSRRVAQVLSTLSGLERSHGFFLNWYDPANGQRARVWPSGGELRPFLSVVDNGWLAAALILVGNSRVEFREATDTLLQPMDFGFFYDPYDARDPVAHPGLLRGGYWPDDETFAGYHYGALNTEPRIASYIGIARGELPPEHYYRMFRASQATAEINEKDAHKYKGILVNPETLSYRGMQFVPTWDGTMFEALMVSMLIPEADWAPSSWGANHPLYVRAQIEYGLHDAQLGYWGLSAASAPGGGYGAFGVAALGVRTHADHALRPREGIIAPYASFLAMPFAPVEALANLKALAKDFPAYGPFGFFDSVDVIDRRVSDRVLILDQGMILAVLSNVIGGDVLRRGFSAGSIEASIRPLIAEERFLVQINPAGPQMTPIRPGVDDLPVMESFSYRPTERSLLTVRPRLLSEHLIGGLLTVVGVSASAMLARRARAGRPMIEEDRAE